MVVVEVCASSFGRMDYQHRVESRSNVVMIGSCHRPSSELNHYHHHHRCCGWDIGDDVRDDPIHPRTGMHCCCYYDSTCFVGMILDTVSR